MSQIFDKDPKAFVDYTVDWALWLVTGASLASSAAVLEGTSSPNNKTDLVVDPVSTFTSPKSNIFLSGGTAGETYTIKVTVTDDQTPQRTGVRRIRIKVKDR